MVILWLLIRAKREDDFMSTSESERKLMEQLWTVVMPTHSGGEDGVVGSLYCSPPAERHTLCPFVSSYSKLILGSDTHSKSPKHKGGHV